MANIDDVMEKIGFSGYGDHTGAGKTIFLSLLFMGFTTLFVYFFINELLVGNPSIFSGFNAYIILGVSVTVAFFAVFWRHKILIVLFCLISAVCVFNIVHIIAIEKNKAYPVVVRELFGATEENIARREALYAERLARTTYINSENLNINAVIPQGGIITIIQHPDNSDYFRRFRYKGEEDKIGTSVFTYLRLDRTYKLPKNANLFAEDSASSVVFTEIPKRQKVVLTGDSSADASMIEVLYKDEKGWIATDNLFGQIEKPKINPFTPLNITIMIAAFVLIYLINYLRALGATKRLKANMHIYYEEKRREFPWLDNWLNKNGEPTINPVYEAFMDLLGKLLLNILLYALIAFTLGFLIRLAMLEFGFYGTGEEKILPAALLVMSIIGLIVSYWVFNSGIRSDEYKNNEECKKCACPHSLLIASVEIIADKEVTETKKITETDSSGSTSTRTEKYTYIVGRRITTLGCQSCKGSYEEIEGMSWDYAPPHTLDVYYKLGASGEWEKNK